MACVSTSNLIWYVAGLAPELGAHINMCHACRTRADNDDIHLAVDAVREVPEAHPGGVVDGTYRVDERASASAPGRP